jgi:RNA polymerase sigma-70 factor (ECF subfamily)
MIGIGPAVKPDTPDGELLDRARAGDRVALEGLLERHQAQVYRFGRRMCRDEEDAKDVVQETLIAMARGVRDFRGASSLSTWLFTIARSFCIKKRRRSRFAPQEERSIDTDAPLEVGRLADPARTPEDIVAGQEVEQALERAIAALSPPLREVLLLRDAEGLTAPEVGEVLGISPQAVKSRLHRARLAVRAQLAPLLGIRGGAPAVPPTCPDVVRVFSRHLEGDVSAEVCAEMERHLAGCASCRGACESLKKTLALCRTAGAAASVPGPVGASVKAAVRAFLSEKA